MQRLFFSLIIALLVWECQSTDTKAVVPETKYSKSITLLKKAIEHEVNDKNLSATSIILIDGNHTIWTEGFGYADRDRSVPAGPQTVYRVGSVSKLFTDIGIMQLVEQGEVDLDRPVTDYLPDFQPGNPFGVTITLRQLMSHRAGLVREPPVGHYFDDRGKTLTETVESLNNTSLVYKPETRIKYSNAGIAVVGYVLEQLHKKPFASYLKEAVLEPMGLLNSSFSPTSKITESLAAADMWTYDGRRFPAPTFELGMSPAGSMYTSVEELGKFMKVLCNDGKAGSNQVLNKETLEAMWTPQFAEEGADSGYGIGFSIGQLEGKKLVGHGGAIYGFATQLYLLPEEKIGVAIATSLDGANAVMTRLAKFALSSMLAERENRLPSGYVTPNKINPEQARKLDGRYQSDGQDIYLQEHDGQLFLWMENRRVEVKTKGDTLITDGPLGFGVGLQPTQNQGLQIRDKLFKRVNEKQPAPAAPTWTGLIGEYGWDHNTLFILEKQGELFALIEWFFQYPLKNLEKDVFAFPDNGLYHGEKIVFQRDRSGKAVRAMAAGIPFERRPMAEAGSTFKISPVKSIEEIRKGALDASPPSNPDSLLKPDLVELIDLDPTIRLDIRYASRNNFMNEIFYRQARAFLQRPAAEALVRVHQKLKQRGMGLLIYDAYRPWHVTKMFYDATPESQKLFVANPYPGSIHNRGAAVDLTLFDLATGQPLPMVSGYDEFSERAFPTYPGGTSLQRWHRELLRDVMEEEGFTVYQWEWWHFNYQDAALYPVLNLQFGELE